MEKIESKNPGTPDKSDVKIYDSKNKDMIASALTSYSKDILMCLLNNGKQVELEDIAERVVKSYNKIRGEIKCQN